MTITDFEALRERVEEETRRTVRGCRKQEEKTAEILIKACRSQRAENSAFAIHLYHRNVGTRAYPRMINTLEILPLSEYHFTEKAIVSNEYRYHYPLDNIIGYLEK